MRRRITEEKIRNYEMFLYEEEKAPATVRKYICDIGRLREYAGDRGITKMLVREYKGHLMETKKYKDRSINSFLASINAFLKYMGWEDAVVKLNKIQKDVFCEENKYLTKAEYKRLTKEALKQGKMQLAMILQTIAAAGIRISELKYVTRAAVKRGCIEIRNKGKLRRVLIPKDLKAALEGYMRKNEIRDGMVFVTSGGNPVDRSNIWRQMKKLAADAGVEEGKVFPHNLRHLFAQCFYAVEKDIAKLADMLGHSRIETTRIYIMATGREHRRQLDKMMMVVN